MPFQFNDPIRFNDGPYPQSLGVSFGSGYATFNRDDETWVRRQLARFTYKRGWRLELRRPVDWIAQAFILITFEAEDAYHPGQTLTIGKTIPLRQFQPLIGDEDAFARYLAYEIQAAEIHESREWLRRDGEIFDDPHSAGGAK